MCDMLQTILYGTFVLPDVAGRLIAFDERTTRIATMPVAKRRGTARAAVIKALQRNPHEWMSIGTVASASVCCDDTAQKILNKLASEQIMLKRFSDTGKRGGRNAVFKWRNQDAKKQKAA